jgi:hypothetical protein
MKLDAATRATLNQTFAEVFAKSGEPDVAASVWIGGERWDGAQGVLGYHSVVLRDPKADATLVAVGNSSTNSSGQASEIVLQ